MSKKKGGRAGPAFRQPRNLREIILAAGREATLDLKRNPRPLPAGSLPSASCHCRPPRTGGLWACPSCRSVWLPASGGGRKKMS